MSSPPFFNLAKYIKLEAKLLYLNVITILSGVFFLLLGVYWSLLFWWTKNHSTPPIKRNFSTFVSFYWILSLYFAAVMSLLTCEVIRKYHVIFSPAKTLDLDDHVMIKIAFSLMLIYLCFCIGAVTVTKLQAIVFNGWKK